MPKKGISYFLMIVLLFSLSILTANAQSSSCENRCNNYDINAACQCDSYCKTAGDCCSDYQAICLSAQNTQSNTQSDTPITPPASTPQLTINGETETGLYYGSPWILKVKGAPNSVVQMFCKTPSGNEICKGYTFCTTNSLGECSVDGAIQQGTEQGTWEEQVSINGVASNLITFGVKATKTTGQENPIITAAKVLPNPASYGSNIRINCNTNFASIPSGCGIYPAGANECVYDGFYVLNGEGNATFSCKAPSSGSSATISCYSNCANLGSKTTTLNLQGSEQAACTDSDGGKNEFVKGIGKGIYAGSSGGSHVIYGTEPNPAIAKPSPYDYSLFYDFCYDSKQLNEAYCGSDGKLHSDGISCPNGCKDGACLQATQPPQAACTDSDGGKNEFIAGKTYINPNEIYYDTCGYAGIQDALIEFYCSYDSGLNKEMVLKELISCKNGCKVGACLPPKECLATSTLAIGNTSIYTVEGKDYEVTAQLLAGAHGLIVNGQKISTIYEGNDYNLADGRIVKVLARTPLGITFCFAGKTQKIAEATLHYGGFDYKIISSSTIDDGNFNIRVDINGNGVIGDIGVENEDIKPGQQFKVDKAASSVLIYLGADKPTANNPVMRFKDIVAGYITEVSYTINGQTSSTLEGAIEKPYVVGNSFWLYAYASSKNSFITSANWELAPGCDYAPVYAQKAVTVSSYVDTSINVVCNNPGLKTFYVTFKDDKGNKIGDKVSVYVDNEQYLSEKFAISVKAKEAGSSTQQSTTATPSPPTSQQATSLTSCANRCGNYNAQAKCQCDGYCTTAGDCCGDKKVLCG